MVIGHQDAVQGFALVGVDGQIATTSEAVNQALDVALNDKNTGIILVTEDAADLARQRVDHLVAHSTVPLVVEIPGPAGMSADRPELGEIIRRTTGVRI
ncbi:MAG TPA: V-type ATP synthase subunit F [Anaerolineae bacterium]|nr:V-type ATP synthase subunit F [Anaerolineae bacterium]HQK15239.1 V-type ATP synthase subunit F [Anaerolineae bacterium]